MALGRFFSGIFAVRFTSRQLIKIGQTITLTAIILLLLPLLSSGYILDFRYLQTITVYDDFVHLCNELESFESNI